LVEVRVFLVRAAALDDRADPLEIPPHRGIHGPAFLPREAGEEKAAALRTAADRLRNGR
jgi:hypothetical protein